MQPLPVIHARDLADGDGEVEWLVEGLWSAGAVGLVGGEPKCCKSFLALDLAVSVASGRPCLGRYPVVGGAGRVMLFAAEDAQKVVKKRLRGIAAARGVTIEDCDLHVINVERLRLDVEAEVAALEATIAMLRPKLLILDPFVRLHRIDENSSAEVAALLDRLRQVQRRHGVAILIVHHAKKNGGSARGGQALRGSSEFHAWVDSLLYVKRAGKGELRLSVEHRAAPSMPDAVSLALVDEAPKLSLEIMEGADEEDDQPKAPTRAPEERIMAALAAGTPMTTKTLRDACGMKTARLCEALDALVAAGRVARTAAGYTAAPT